jgi:hypothetical protein
MRWGRRAPPKRHNNQLFRRIASDPDNVAWTTGEFWSTIQTELKGTVPSFFDLNIRLFTGQRRHAHPTDVEPRARIFPAATFLVVRHHRCLPAKWVRTDRRDPRPSRLGSPVDNAFCTSEKSRMILTEPVLGGFHHIYKVAVWRFCRLTAM